MFIVLMIEKSNVWKNIDFVDKIFNTVYQKMYKKSKHNLSKINTPFVHKYKYPSCSDVV